MTSRVSAAAQSTKVRYMWALSTDARRIEQARKILDQPPGIGIPGKAHHEIPERIYHVDMVRRSARRGKRLDEPAAGGSHHPGSREAGDGLAARLGGVAHYPRPLDAVHVLALGELQLPHVHEFF